MTLPAPKRLLIPLIIAPLCLVMFIILPFAAQSAHAWWYCGQACWKDDKPDPWGAPTCEDLGGFCRNRQCICGATDPGVCPWVNPGDSCAARGLTCSSGSCTIVHVTDCRCISGYAGGCISYCADDLCAPGTGGPCQKCNVCGMCGSGTVQCDGSCNATRPADSLCNANPIGWQEMADCTMTGGWTFDPDYAGSTTVHLYEGAAFLGAVTANQSRPDVGAVYPGRTNSGWSWPIPAGLKNGVNHTITAYAINVNAAGIPTGPNPGLSGTPKTINCNQPPTGTLAAAACGSPTGLATGTASDPQSASVVTVIYDGQAGAGGVQIGVGNATPAFSIPFTSFSDGQTHNVYAYSQDVPTGTWHQLIGVSPVTCAPTVTLSSAPATVGFGEAATITWSVRNATACTPSPAGSWYNPASLVNGVANSSGTTGPLVGPTTYSLTCRNAAGVTVVGTVTVGVTIPPPTGTITNVTDTSYCAGGAGMNISWQYDSAAAAPGFYQVEVINNATGQKVYDSGKQTATVAESDVALAPLPEVRPPFWARVSGILVSSLTKLFSR